MNTGGQVKALWLGLLVLGGASCNEEDIPNPNEEEDRALPEAAAGAPAAMSDDEDDDSTESKEDEGLEREESQSSGKKASCKDGELNQDETDVDCGGSCDACEDLLLCNTAADCLSGVCGFAGMGGAGGAGGASTDIADRTVCLQPTCDDSVMNGAETALDCGGDCATCSLGESCSVDVDCETGRCDKGICAANCGNGILEGAETCEEEETCSNKCQWSSRYLFVTSTLYDGDLGGLDGADAKCQSHADAASLPGQYKAWLGAGTAGPSSRFTQSTVAYVLPTGKRVALNYLDLVNGVSSLIDEDENGDAVARDADHHCVKQFNHHVAWGGVRFGGTPWSNGSLECSNYTSTSGGHSWSNLGLTRFFEGCIGGSCSDHAPLICVQQ